MKLLITSDLHFTSNVRDSYRWSIFPWLVEQCLVHKVDGLAIGGDITDAKDRHPSVLVNTMVENFKLFKENNIPVFLLKGNHDYIEPTLPFFKLLNQFDNIHYVLEKELFVVGEGKNKELFLCVSHCREGISTIAFSKEELKADLLFTHHTFSGSIGSNGHAIDGESQEVLLPFKGMVISGDIHTPQTLGKVIYVGTPYRVHFNDDFEPRVFLYNSKELTELHFPCLKRHTIKLNTPEELLSYKGVSAGDQIKVRLRLKREQFSQWVEFSNNIKKYAEQRNLEVCGVELEVSAISRIRIDGDEVSEKKVSQISPKEVLFRWAQSEKLSDDVIKVGESLL